MNWDNVQNLALNLKTYMIPIEQYNDDIDLIQSKEEKTEILELFTKSNELHSEEEFKEIEQKLHKACKIGNIELIKIYLSKRIENESKDLVFKINRTRKTASLIKVSDKIKNLLIPRTFQHESTEYLITSITGTHRGIRSIKFVENSAVNTIYYGAFSCSSIEEIYFPASLKELKEGWCNETYKLTKIIISPLNDQFIYKNGEYLLGKTDPNSAEFDNFLFARRDIEKIFIPSNIKVISPFAFYNCSNLTKIEIQQNSDLQTIEKCAFLCSNIKEIFIPSKVSKICKDAFSNCSNLTKVLIPPNSNLESIGSNAFLFSKIEELYFPPKLKELKEGWCCRVDKLKKITISPLNGQFVFKDDKYLLGKMNENNDDFDNFLFARRGIEKISIPSNIKVISPFAFYNCSNLKKVKIQQNSNLQIIESHAFSYSNVDEIFIPSNIKIIQKYAFSNCSNLKKVEIPLNSNLQTIESNAFSDSKIEEIYFPSTLRELKDEWCCGLNNLTKIIISPLNGQFVFKDEKYLLGKTDPRSDEFDNLLFSRRDIKEISIPSNIKIISSYAFDNCKNLAKIEIPPNSNLQTIETYAFSASIIKNIFIPPKVSKICKKAFFYCLKLNIIEISEESKLDSFPLSAFFRCSTFIIMIPSSLTKLTHTNDSI